MPSAVEVYMQAKLSRRHQHGNLRCLGVPAKHIDFASNDYLGFSRNSRLKQNIATAWQVGGFPLGATGSRLLTGNHHLFELVESEIASFHEAPCGLIYNSGYMANVGLLSAIAKSNDIYLYDAHIHASMRDGLKLSGATCYPWRHNDLDHLEKRLKGLSTTGQVFVCVESLYSCDGSLSALKELCLLCNSYNAVLIVDEAHASGVLGPDGKGLAVALACEKNIFARIHTFSKALGLQGAIVLGSPMLIRFLVNFSRTFIYSTAMSLPGVVGVREAYKLLPHQDQARAKLQALIGYFKRQAEISGVCFWPSSTQIQALAVSGNSKAHLLATKLQAEGIDGRILLSPTVQRGNECLRICLHAFNTHDEIDQLFACLKRSE